MKNKLSIVLLGLLLLSSCSRHVKIGFLMDDSERGRWAKDKALFIKHVEAMGEEVVFRSGERSPEKQYDMAMELLNEGIDVLVLIPADQYLSAKIVLEAHKKNIRVISYDRMVRNCLVDFYVSFDHVHVGELQAQYISTICPVGNYAILGGAKTDNNAFLLRLGLLNVLQPYVDKGDVNVVYDNYAEAWAKEEGYRMMNECLKKNEDIDAVIAANDVLAGGAIEAMNEWGMKKKVFVAGMDADLEACQRIFAGTQSMTVYKPIEAIAVKAAELAIQIAKENKVPSVNLSVNNGNKQVPSVLLPAMIVNKETMDLTVIADGYLQENNIKVE